MINDRYQIGQKIGQGSFASVHTGIDTKTKKEVAIKLIEKSLLNVYKIEIKVLSALSGLPHFPKLYWSGMHDKKFCLVMELLGKSLSEILKSRAMPPYKICDLGYQMTTALEIMHKQSFIHRDIKPENIVLGQEPEDYYYLIDYGLSKSFIDTTTKHHAPLREDMGFKGNLVFCSNNILSGVSASRRDDIESLNLLIIYLFKQELPWLRESNNLECMIGRRSSISNEYLLKDLPDQIIEIFKYTQHLNYYQEPNYAFIKEKFKDCRDSNMIRNIPVIPKKKKKKTVNRSKTTGLRKLSVYQNDTIILPPPEFSNEFRERLKKLRSKT